MASIFTYLTTLNYGITRLSQYTYLFVLSINPIIFKLFNLRHYAIFSIGILASIFQHRAILPFILLIIIDLDYEALNARMRQRALLFFGLSLAILIIFGGSL